MSRFSFTNRSSKLKERKRKILQLKIFLGVFFVAILVGLSVWIFHSTEIDFSQVTIDGTAVVDKGEVKTIIENVLHGSYAYIFPKSSALIYPRRSLEATLLEVLPTFQSVQVKTKHFSELDVTVVERKPYALACPPHQDPAADGCFFVDRDGFVFQKAPQVSEGTFVRYSDATTTSLTIGTKIFPDSFPSLILFNAKLETLHVKTEAVEKNADDDYVFLLDQGVRLFVSARDFDSAFENLNTLVTESFTKKLGDKPFLKIDYIDLRFGNRLYYKLK